MTSCDDFVDLASMASYIERELSRLWRLKVSETGEVISSFFSTTIELVSFDDEKTGIDEELETANGCGISLKKTIDDG